MGGKCRNKIERVGKKDKGSKRTVVLSRESQEQLHMYNRVLENQAKDRDKEGSCLH